MVLVRRVGIAAAIGLCSALTAMACSSSSGSSSGSGGDGGGALSDPFVGTWMCTGSSMTVETLPDMKATTDVTMSSIVITDDGTGNDTVVRTPEGDAVAAPCTEPAKLSASGTTLTITGMPKCPSAISGVTETFTSVSYTLAAGNTSFTTMASYTLSGTTTSGMTYAATGTATNTCNKM
jgi:hypothetical protein